MNVDIKEQWVRALRSGEYTQGVGNLCVDGEYCCLGVLTDLAAKAGVVEWDTHQYGKRGVSGEVSVLPVRVRDWAGLPSVNPDVRNRGVGRDYAPLAGLNDDGLPFGRLAELIEEQF